MWGGTSTLVADKDVSRDSRKRLLGNPGLTQCLDRWIEARLRSAMDQCARLAPGSLDLALQEPPRLDLAELADRVQNISQSMVRRYSNVIGNCERA